MARKPRKPAELKLRIPRGLHQLIENAAHKNERSLNQEAILRLQQSFSNELMTSVIELTATRVGEETNKSVLAHLDGVIDEFNRVFQILGRPDLAIHTKQREGDDGK